jgi:hypothetical protein
MLPPTSITQALSLHFIFTSSRKLTGDFKNGIIFLEYVKIVQVCNFVVEIA